MTTATDFVTDLRERMAADGFTLPDSWAGIMEATVAGAIDADDLPEVLGECSRIVDAEVARQQGKRQLITWREIASRFYTEVLEHREPAKELTDLVVQMGQCADAVLRGDVE